MRTHPTSLSAAVRTECCSGAHPAPTDPETTDAAAQTTPARASRVPPFRSLAAALSCPAALPPTLPPHPPRSAPRTALAPSARPQIPPVPVTPPASLTANAPPIRKNYQFG